MSLRGLLTATLAIVEMIAMVIGSTGVWAEPDQKVKDAIDVIVLMCVAGGTKYEFQSKGNIEGGFALKKLGIGAAGEIQISRSEARGLVEGLQNAMTQIASEQASAARDCMRPWIERILKEILGDASDPSFYMEHRIQYLLARLENFT